MSDKALVKHLQKELARLENELRSPAPASSNCDYAALLRKKDLQIEKMEKEIRELIKQRDLAQSQVEDLLLLVGDDRDTGKSVINGHCPISQAEETWEDDCSESGSSLTVDWFGQNAAIKKLNGTHRNEDKEENPVTNDSPSQLEDTRATNREDDPDEYCKDVRCIEMVESTEKNMESGVNGDVASQDAMSAELNGNGEGTHAGNLSNYGALEQRLNDVQRTVDQDEPSPSVVADRISDFRNFILSSSRNYRDNDLNSEPTPPSEFQKDFSGSPEGVNSKGIPRLSRNNSQSSLGTISIAPSIGPNGDEDITSIRTFVAGMREMADAYEKQLAEESVARNMNDVLLDPMQESFMGYTDWPVKFERMQRMVIELWQACNVPLIHRTYFFLLFRGDPADSIYMEVELRRLTFMKEMFAGGGQAISNGRNITLASSLKALHRERQKLSRLMRRRLSEEVRERLFERWGIGLGTKQRRLQLANCLWSDAEDMDRVMESASIVAKLVKFTEQGQALKGMLGLSFSTPPSRRRSFGWKHSMASLL